MNDSFATKPIKYWVSKLTLLVKYGDESYSCTSMTNLWDLIRIFSGSNEEFDPKELDLLHDCISWDFITTDPMRVVDHFKKYYEFHLKMVEEYATDLQTN